MCIPTSERTEMIRRENTAVRSHISLSDVVGASRAVIGIAYMLTPTRANRLLAGEDASLPTTRAASRTFGIREIYLGGSVIAARRFAPTVLKPLLLAGVVVDLWDAGAFAATAYLPSRTRRGGVAVAVGFATAGLVASRVAASSSTNNDAM